MLHAPSELTFRERRQKINKEKVQPIWMWGVTGREGQDGPSNCEYGAIS